MELQGVTGAPYSHPITRRKLPAPFTRPSINSTGGKPVKRYWKDIPILEVKKGDTVADFGVVEATAEFLTGDLAERADMREWRIRLYNVVGEFKDFSGHQRVYAFTAEDTNG